MNAPKRFPGFPTRTGFTPIPNPFFSAVLPEIQDLSELRVTLHVFWALYRKKGYPRFVTYGELRGDQALMSSFSAEEELRHGLETGVGRGTLLCLKMDRDGEPEELYFLNTELSRRAVVQIENGEIHLGGMVRIEPAATEERRNVFTLYEENIGLLTPLIAEDLKEAERLYPASWIEDAFREAVRLNKRNWRYISRILERWASRGKDYGTTRESPEKDISPKEYIQKYRHLTRK
ncbi:DnaD domain protein [Dehalococcoidia bacterium]|nr:DnaD domain protein [Dehalococcoidia bacterium]MCL0089914.1 DnaD domain protein [Dehalococcoidia bacterium]